MRFATKATWTLAFCMLVGALGTVAQAQDEQATRMKAALASPNRPQADKDRDAARKPIETIQFLGIKSGQTVIDVVAAGGWFTEVLSAAVGPKGKVYGQNPEFFVNREGFAAAEKARNDRLGNVTPVHGELAANNIKGADAAITALNMHDIYNGPGGEAAAVAFAKGVFDALKPGGVFGVIDHAGIAGQDNAKFHRIQEQQAKDVLTKAGFVIEAESNILHNPADDHTKGVRDPSVAGHTDQFLIRARKPG
ncbi:MAG TPA: methyltransferase [Gammaproteobacteria bacterium]|nr:methyltransferase [Gammaproteobacteria bacterium]